MMSSTMTTTTTTTNSAPNSKEKEELEFDRQQPHAHDENVVSALIARARLEAEDSGQCAEAGAFSPSPVQVWAKLHPKLTPDLPFRIHQECYARVYQNVQDIKPTWIPSNATQMEQTNICQMIQRLGLASYRDLYEYSIDPTTRDDFWRRSVEAIGVVWDTPPSPHRKVMECDATMHTTTYFPGAKLNIADSCLDYCGSSTATHENYSNDMKRRRSSEDPALVYAMECDPRNLQTMSFGVLDALSNQIANALQQTLGLQPGDAVAICMPMTPESIAIYLGIVKAACVVVSIADSFSAHEIALRCKLAGVKAIFTQDVIYRAQKFLPLYQRVVQADALMRHHRCDDKHDHDGHDEFNDDGSDGETKETKVEHDTNGYSSGNINSDNINPMRIVVLPGMLHAGPYPKLKDMHRSDSGTWNDKDQDGKPISLHLSIALRPHGLDCSWHDFLHGQSSEFTSVKCDSMNACNILFSSGTTGTPKAIVWSHCTPIKCALDGFYHQDIQTGDRVCWPTNIGWMMGPWLLFQMINGATIGIFNGVTSTDAFCQFVEEARINMVGVIPSLVKAWQARNATKHVDWSCVKKFSSTGEASNADNYLWLASRVPGYAPIMEYCGGTEIGGSFLSSTMVQPNIPSMFSSPVLGSQLWLLDSEGNAIEESRYCQGPKCTQSGEVALVPPTVGLSTRLLNRNHYDTYFKDMKRGPNGEVLRRHGDEIQFVRNVTHCSGAAAADNDDTTCMPYFRALGRCDDTMNIGGIKVSSVEIERACNLVAGVRETAAIAVSDCVQGGPCKLIVYVVLMENSVEQASATLHDAMQKSIKANLNPLFGISDVVVTASLPRTASNKVMRRLLRDQYVQQESKR